MIALYSLWNMGNAGNTASFNSVDDLMATLKLSMLQSQKFFEKVVLVTDSIGAARAKEYALPCELIVAFDELDVKDTYWALPKLIAMKMMKQPFAHIDNDFIFWQDPKPIIADADLCFQNIEKFSVYEYYTETLDEIKQKAAALYDKTVNADIQYAYNCGMVACSRLQVLDEWLGRARSFVAEADAIPDFSHMKGCFNHLLEQYIIALIIHEQSLRANVLLKELDMNTTLFTHLWGATKRNPVHLDGVRAKLRSIMSAN